MKYAKIASFITIASIIISLVTSCGNKEPSVDTASGVSDKPLESDTEQGQFSYEYPDINCGGDTFTFLNSTTTWGFYTNIDFENLTGETLDDAVYNRNRFVEDKFNIKFEIIEYGIDSCYNMLRTAILAGDNIYDVALCRGDKLSPFILENQFVNLLDYPEFKVEQPWWDQSIMKQALIGDGKQLFFASTDFSLVGFDGTLCMFFNENMLENLGLTAPYDLVRSGNWTIDRLNEYMKAGANLNGDVSFTWNASGNAVYGMTSFGTCATALLIGSNESYIIKDEKNQPRLGVETARFYDVAEKIASVLGVEGNYLNINISGTEGHYESIFKAGRALFLCAELKASSKYRDMDANYGIVPTPKYDEMQNEYRSFRSNASLLMSVPITNTEVKRTGIIMDALSYISYTEVLPIYYNVNVSQKRLRNDDSIEMLEIIRDSRFFDIGKAYGWTDDIYSAIQVALNAGSTDIASIVAANKDKVNENIKKTLELMK